MTDLTEQWKKGELPEGFYYIKVKEVMANYPLLANCVEGLSYTYFLDYEDYVTEVLDKVPSYSEYLALQSDSLAKNEAVEINAELEAENAQLKELLHGFAESNQSLRKRLDGEKAKNRIDYYDGSPMDFLDECERDRKKNKIYKNLINNIRDELIISDLRRIDEGNKFIVGILSKIDEVMK